MILRWSPTPGFTKFTYETVKRVDGTYLAYSRGTDECDSLEFALLRGDADKRIPPYCWRLYPEPEIAEHSFRNDWHRAEYEMVRRQLCFILHQLRTFAWSNPDPEYKVDPLFRLTTTDPPNPNESTRENAEIHRAMDLYIASLERDT